GDGPARQCLAAPGDGRVLHPVRSLGLWESRALRQADRQAEEGRMTVDVPTLDELGWSAALAADHGPHAALGREPARIMAEDRGSYLVRTARGERRAALTGPVPRERGAATPARFGPEAGTDPSVSPAVGDWVAIDGGPDDAAIHAVLARRTAI